jgi:hypothetical protein
LSAARTEPTARRPTLVATTVDTEEEWDWNAGWPTGATSVANIGQLPRFQAICDRHGIAATYFVNHAVLANPDTRSAMLTLAERDRVELGMHIHPWNTPPLDALATVRARESFLHNLPERSIDAKLTTVYELFRDCGLRPTSFRGGRYSSGGAIHRFLREHGFLVDASVVPYCAWHDDGAPDYRQRGPEPVRLAPESAGAAPLWELPLTYGFTRGPDRLWARAFEVVETTPVRHLRLIGLAERLGLVARVWLNFEDPLGERMLPYLRALRRRGPTMICFTIHSSSLLAGGNPYTRTRADEDRVFSQIDQIFGTLSEWDEFRPATVTEIATELEERYHASARHQPVG